MTQGLGLRLKTPHEKAGEQKIPIVEIINPNIKNLYFSSSKL